MRDEAEVGTAELREYMLEEAVHQYKDYYESDPEEHGFFEFLDNLPSRDRVRFMEIFEDFTVSRKDNKGFKMIPKREFNPELSFLQNFVLDLVDFRDRVQPMARDVALMDMTHEHQSRSVEKARAEMLELEE